MACNSRIALRVDARRGPAPPGVGSERTSSRWPQIAKQNAAQASPIGLREAVFHTPPRRGRALAKRDEAQGAAETREGPADLHSAKQVKCL